MGTMSPVVAQEQSTTVLSRKLRKQEVNARVGLIWVVKYGIFEITHINQVGKV